MRVQRFPLIPFELNRRRFVLSRRIVPLMIINITKPLIVLDYRIDYFYNQRKKSKVELVRGYDSYINSYINESDCIILFKKQFDTNLCMKIRKSTSRNIFRVKTCVILYFSLFYKTYQNKFSYRLAYYIIVAFGSLRQ